MISVLIPVYNYKIQPLVEEIVSQFNGLDCNWEVLISDDNSEVSYQNINSNFVTTLNKNNVCLFQQNENLGNGVNRNYLIHKSAYKWLLFLDADVMPVVSNFISLYLNYMQKVSNNIIIGNIVYDMKRPLHHLLRFNYGVKKEQVNFNERKLKPILNARGANFAIKKSLALKFNFPSLIEKYGFVDTRFFLQFNEKDICVIENPVYHLGIEENEVFLGKTKKAISNAFYLLNSNDKLSEQITIVSKYKKVRLFKRLLAFLYLILNKRIENNIKSVNPSFLLFQLYKILYISYLDVFEDRS